MHHQVDPRSASASLGNRPSVVLLGLALFALTLAGCGGKKSASRSGADPGTYGASYYVGIYPPAHGTVTSTDGRIDCGPGVCGAAEYRTRYDWAVANVTLNAAPAAGYKFTGWAGDCSGKGACVLTRGADRYVVAVFEPLAAFPGSVFLVQLDQPAGGTITASGDASFDCRPQGSASSYCGPATVKWTGSVTLTATPLAGYRFQGWTGDCSGSGPCVLDTRTVQSDKAVGAVFVPTDSHAVTVTREGAGSGSITADVAGQPTQTCGSAQPTCTFYAPIADPPASLVLTGLADAGSHFLRWAGNCGGPGVCVLEVDGPKSATATFTPELAGSTVVTSTGGEVVSQSTGVTISIPSAALDAPTGISVSVATNPPPLPPDLQPISQIYSFEPEGQVFSTPITVRLPVPPGTTSACIYWQQHAAVAYECIGGTIKDGTIETEVSHFSDAFVGPASPTRTIQGTRLNAHLASQGTIATSSDGLERETVAAWVRDVSGGFSRHAGQGLADGTFHIAGVPEGDAVVQVSQSVSRFHRFVATSGSTLDMGEIVDGLPGLTPVPNGSPMRLNWHVSGLDPAGGDLEVLAPAANDWGTLYVPPGPTDLAMTTVPFTTSLVRPVHVLDGARASILFQQLVPATSAGGYPYSRFTRSMRIGGISVGPSIDPASVSFALVDRGATSTASFDVDVARLSQTLRIADGVPCAWSRANLAVQGQPGSFLFGMRPAGRKRTLLRSSIASPPPMLSTGDMSFAPVDPTLQDAWGLYWSAALSCGRTIPGPPGVASVTVATTMTAYGPYEPLAPRVSVGAPALTAPRNVQVDGKPLSSAQTGISETPTITWGAPEIAPEAGVVYSIRVTRLLTGETTRDELVAYLHTDKTSFTLPPGVLAKGGKYTLLLTATTGARLDRPARATLPMNEANQQTAWFEVASDRFGLGGSVSGLTAPGLVLSSPGQPPLQVQAGATDFRFATGVPSGGAYDVTVVTQPEGLECSVANGAGIQMADVQGVAVSCVPGAGAPGVPVALSFLSSPSTARAGEVTGPIRVGVVDAFGTPVTSGTHAVTLAGRYGPASKDAPLLGTTTAWTVNGEALFLDVAPTVAGPGVLEAVADALAPATAPLEVSGGTFAELSAYWAAPTPLPDPACGPECVGPLTLYVTAVDAFDNATQPPAGVAVSVASGPAGGVLSGTPQQRLLPDGSQLEITGLSLNVAGWYALRVSSGGVQAAPVALVRSAGTPVAATSTFSVIPPSVPADGETETCVKLTARDAYGNPTERDVFAAGENIPLGLTRRPTVASSAAPSDGTWTFCARSGIARPELVVMRSSPYDGPILGSATFVFTPPPPGYVLAGTVSGLEGSGLKLVTAGRPGLVVPAGATSFAFPAPLPSGTAYDVQVTVQPSNPPQTCTVANGSGTIGGDVTNVAITCGSLFGADASFAGGGSTGEVALADVNADGVLDLLISKYYAATVTVRLGNGDGTFGAGSDVATGTSPWGIGVGDFDRDGRLDLAVTNNTGVSVLLGRGDGTFGPKTELSTGTQAYLIAVGDLDGDGILDLATTRYTSGVSVLRGRGDGTFHPRVDYATSAVLRELTAADLDGDGRLDLACVSRTAPVVSVLRNRGDGTFAAKVDYDTGSLPSSVVAADLNGDGKLDLATGLEASSIAVFLNRGDGTFGARTDHPTGGYPLHLAAADFDEDGKIDLAAANMSSSSLSLLTGHGDGTFAPEVRYATASGPSFLRTGDLDRDGKPDLLFVTGADLVHVLLDTRPPLPVTWSMFAPPRLASVGDVSTAIADVNGDGKLDLLGIILDGTTAPGSLAHHLGNGDGTFTGTADAATGVQPVRLRTGDLDRDGLPDAVVVNHGERTVRTLLARADGSFAPGRDFPAGGAALALALGDFDRDGKLDAVTSDWEGTGLYTMAGGGDGTFGPPAPAGNSTALVTRIEVGDFNRDAKLDLLTLNEDDSLNLLLGRGDGTFEQAVLYAAPYGAWSVAVADLDRDGRLDALAAGYGGTQIYYGTGAGTLVEGPWFAGHHVSSSIGVGDVNLDGFPDFVVREDFSDGTTSRAQATLFVGAPGRTFERVDLQVAITGFNAALADFNGDGRLDLFVSGNVALRRR